MLKGLFLLFKSLAINYYFNAATDYVLNGQINRNSMSTVQILAIKYSELTDWDKIIENISVVSFFVII